MNALQHLVTTRLAELKLSYRQAESRSRGLVSRGTIGKIATGRHRSVLHDTSIAGLALALDLPESAIRAAAKGPNQRPVEFLLPAKASRLSPRGRDAMLTVLNALLVAEDAARQLATESDGGTTEDDGRASSV